MRKSLLITILCLMAIALPSCRTTKTEVITIPTEEQEPARWKNVTIPVRLELTEPQKFTITGRMTMERNESALITLRMLGFDVAQIYVTPSEADVVIRQMNKIWIQEPIADRLEKFQIPFSTIQQALMADREAFDKLPAGLGLSLNGTKEKPVITIKITAKGKTLSGNMTLSMNEAKWDAKMYDAFKKPTEGEYKKVTLKDLGKIL